MSEETFDQEAALKRYTRYQHYVSVGAYQERDDDGSYGEDGIEEGIDDLDFQAAKHGLKFEMTQEERETPVCWSLVEMTQEERDHFALSCLLQNLEDSEREEIENSLQYIEKRYGADMISQTVQSVSQALDIPALELVQACVNTSVHYQALAWDDVLSVVHSFYSIRKQLHEKTTRVTSHEK